MGISLSDQTAYFLWSLVLGVSLGVLYDVLRMIRMTLRAGRLSVMITDIVFFALCGVLTSLFALPFNKGDVRGFILFGEAAGFLVYRLTLGSVMGKVYAILARVLRAFVQKIRKFLEIFFNYLLKSIGFLVYNVSEVIDRLLRILSKKIDSVHRRGYYIKKETQYEQKKHKNQDRREAKRR